MNTATDLFFDRLSRTGHDPRLVNADGTIRFELADGDRTLRWTVAIKQGDITVMGEDPATGRRENPAPANPEGRRSSRSKERFAGSLATTPAASDRDGLCTLHASREVFDQIVAGEMNVVTAALRGAISYDGDPKFAILFRRLFAGPDGRADALPEPGPAAKPGGKRHVS